MKETEWLIASLPVEVVLPGKTLDGDSSCSCEAVMQAVKDAHRA